ncbi:MAG: Hsp20/alpha crystallin family protein [Candidatus Hydrogenedentes bacterium]|nr:Hsp20/alpha crystallin family protein [Candidatus Hydrogenedentota bacterium]
MRDLNQMLNQMQGLMQSLQGAASIEHVSSSTWQPLVDIYERRDCLIIVVELPGVKKEHITVTVSEGVLRIAGVRAKQIPEGTQQVHLMEIPYGPFVRFLKLPPCASIENIEVEYADGYLTLRVHRNRDHD